PVGRPKQMMESETVQVRMPGLLADALRAADAQRDSPQGLSAEVRERLERTYYEDLQGDAQTRQLMNAILNLASLVKLQTGHDWHSHAGANRVMRHAITARLARLKPDGEPTFKSNELPKSRLVAPGSDDVEHMGLGLEALDFSQPLRPSTVWERHD